jgi:hypothetical protein
MVPSARFFVVTGIMYPLNAEAGPGCFQARPISCSLFTTFGARRPSRLGAALTINVQWFVFWGRSQSWTTRYVLLSSACMSFCFQNHPSVSVTHEKAGIALSVGKT